MDEIVGVEWHDDKDWRDDGLSIGKKKITPVFSPSQPLGQVLGADASTGRKENVYLATNQARVVRVTARDLVATRTDAGAGGAGCRQTVSCREAGRRALRGKAPPVETLAQALKDEGITESDEDYINTAISLGLPHILWLLGRLLASSTVKIA